MNDHQTQADTKVAKRAKEEKMRAERDTLLIAMGEGIERNEPGRGRKGAKEEKKADDKKRTAADKQAKTTKRALGANGKKISSHLMSLEKDGEDGEDGEDGDQEWSVEYDLELQKLQQKHLAAEQARMEAQFLKEGNFVNNAV